MEIQTTLKMFSIKYIRNEVKGGKTKKQVANEIGISYYKVRKYTRDIYRSLRIPYKLEKQIREEVKNGKTKKQVAEEYGLCTRTVSRYTRDIKTNKPASNQFKKTIREEVLKCKSKMKVARMLNISYNTVLYHTRDIITKKKTSQKLIEKIRKEVIGGKSRYQVLRDFNLSYPVVWKYTKDIPVPNHKEYFTGIRGRSLELLKLLLTNGYHICIRGDVIHYRILKEYIPTIYKVHLYNKTIIFLEEKSNEAIRGFLEHINKRKISFHELEKISKVFKSKLSKTEKEKYSSRS
jgi:DNA-binding CsgD family transcriptional regulator